jgi:hypothetical protein
VIAVEAPVGTNPIATYISAFNGEAGVIDAKQLALYNMPHY